MTAGRLSVLVLYPDDWASFSPTLTRLVDLLQARFEVRAVVFDTGRYDLDPLDPAVYRRASLTPRVAALLRKMRLLRLVRIVMLAFHARDLARRAVHVIAVDADGAAASCLLARRMHYLSLEIGRASLAPLLVRWLGQSIVIQSRARLEYQFPARTIQRMPVFLVQNAPNFSTAPSGRDGERNLARPRLVYLGSAIPEHGLYPMLDLVRAWPDATLTLQGILPSDHRQRVGATYGDLIESGRLSIRDSYLRDEDVASFLSGFDIGLCLYEPPERKRMDFNYVSSPAGKMFNYFAAGLPVLASDLIGLGPVREFDAGVQVPSNAVADLLSGARSIVGDYDRYRAGAVRAAAAHDFAAAASGFIDFLESETAQS